MADSAQRFKAIVDDFEAALDTLLAVLQHVANTKPEAKLRIVIFNNTIVALTSTIEEYLRALFREYLAILEESFLDYRELQGSLQKSNLECAILVLRSYNKEKDLAAAADLISNLEKCLKGKSGYRLLKEEIVYNQGNFKSGQVTDVSKNVGISELWHRVCDCTTIEDHTGEVDIEARVTRLTAQWNGVFDERDLVVHRFSQASGWGSELIEQSINLGRLVVTRIAACLAEEANDQVTKAGTR